MKKNINNEFLNEIFSFGFIYTAFRGNLKLPQIGSWKYIGSEFSIIGIIDYYVRAN